MSLSCHVGSPLLLWLAFTAAGCDDSTEGSPPLLITTAQPPDPSNQAGAPTTAPKVEVTRYVSCGDFTPPPAEHPPARSERQVFGISVAPDGQSMVVTDAQSASAYHIANRFEDSAWLWDAHTGLAILSQFSPDGTMVAISGDGRDLVAADGGELLFRPAVPVDAGPEGCSQAYLNFSHDGHYLAGGGYRYVVDVFETSGHAKEAALPSQSCNSSAAFSPDDSLIATSTPELYRSADFSRVWPAEVPQEATDAGVWAKAVEFSPNGKELLVSRCSLAARSATRMECQHALYDVVNGDLLDALPSKSPGFAVFSPSGEQVLVGNLVLDRNGADPQSLWPDFANELEAYAFTPHGDIIAASSGGVLHRFCVTH